MTGVSGRFGRFILVGLLGAALQVLLILLFTKHFNILGALATPIAVEITIVHNFVWHERFTWIRVPTLTDGAPGGRGHRSIRQVARRLWRFHAGNGLISLAGNTILMYGLVECLEVPIVPATLAAIASLAFVNFLVADRWVFAHASAHDGSSPVPRADHSGASHHLVP